MKKSRKRRKAEAEKEKRKALLLERQRLRQEQAQLISKKKYALKEEHGHADPCSEDRLDREEILKISQYIYEQMKLRMDKTFLNNGKKIIHSYEQSHAVTSAWETVVPADKDGESSKPFGADLGEDSLTGQMTLNQKIRYLIEPHIRARGFSEKDLLRLAGSKAESLESEELTKDRILLYAILLQMDPEVTGKLLAMAGYDFGRISRRNLILSYYLQIGVRDPKLVNQALSAFGEPLLK